MQYDLKMQIKTAIADVVSGSGIEVATDYEHTCPNNFNGNDRRNIVNRISRKAVQIEQSKEAGKHYGTKIANAVAEVLGSIP